MFATQPDTPAPGLSLYRFSAGHGGLQCSACHGSTHAEFPATHRNDNLRNEKIQGHGGVTAECTACHVSMPNNRATAVGGPHGMHPIGQGWVSYHHDAITSDNGHQQCAVCHGADFRGTVLSRTLGPRTLTANLDGGSRTLRLFQGAIVGCYNCHNGPRNENINTTAPPAVANVSANTKSGQQVEITLPVSGANAIARIVSQPSHGSVGLSNLVATYFPDPGFVGVDTFTFAAWNGSRNSTLATGMVAVAEGPYSIAVRALVPPQYPALWSVPFGAVGMPSNTLTAVTYEWSFGDGSPVDTRRHATHQFREPGSYSWSVTARVGEATATAAGVIEIGTPVNLAVAAGHGEAVVSWPRTVADSVLESAGELASPTLWRALNQPVSTTPTAFRVNLTPSTTNEFFRLRQVR